MLRKNGQIGQYKQVSRSPHQASGACDKYNNACTKGVYWKNKRCKIHNRIQDERGRLIKEGGRKTKFEAADSRVVGQLPRIRKIVERE